MALTTGENSSTMMSTTVPTMNLNTWILVLNFRSSSNVPMIIDGNGQSKNISLTYDSENEVSCSIVWRGAMYVFGRWSISMVDGCQLKRIGELTFEFRGGCCAQRSNEKVFLCFAWDSRRPTSSKDCHESNGPLEVFTELPSSNYEHSYTRTAATEGKPRLSFVEFCLKIYLQNT